METLHHGPIMTIPVGLMPSVMAIPSLATIPGSAAPTPSPHGSGEVPTLKDSPSPVDPPEVEEFMSASSSFAPSFISPAGSHIPLPRVTSSGELLEPPDPYANLESTSSQDHFVTPLSSPSQPPPGPVPGSYFPATSSTIPLVSATPPLPSKDPEPDRPRAEIEIEIPVGTPNEPLFSAYPQVDDASTVLAHKAKAFHIPIRSLTLSRPPKPRNSNDSADGPSVPTSPRLGHRPRGRRRASTVGSAPQAQAIPTTDRRGSHDETGTPGRALAALYAITPSKSLKHFRSRRASLSSVTDLSEFARRYRNRHHAATSESDTEGLSQAFPYPPDRSGSVLQPETTQPAISPRKSSLARSVVNTAPSPARSVEVVVAEEIPHGPPPRRSSLVVNFDKSSIVADNERLLAGANVVTDVHSVLSSSLTMTETSASVSAECHTSSGSTDPHPLSSTSTSLSRSVKSGKEGPGGVSAIKLQKSLEWEAKQTRARRRIERRRMVLLELVETEVAYAQDLKTLVHVYLPQLFALPGLSEITTRAIARNSDQLLRFHEAFMSRMVLVMVEEGMVPTDMALESGTKLEKVARRLASLFVDEVAEFSAYNEYCAGSIMAASLVRRISLRPDYDAFERRCQVIAATLPHRTLADLMIEATSAISPVSAPTSPYETSLRNRNRLHFRDFLIMPIQRVCRYPLLLNQMLGATSSPERDDSSIQINGEGIEDKYDVGVDVERALGAMKGVAEEADEARRLKDIEIKTATILDRLEPHPALSSSFLKTLGKCRLVGSLDVLHHHPTIAPLMPPVKVKYLGAFLYRGYLILAKVKRGKTYEVRHYLPLEVFELIDIEEGFLPHCVRLNLRDHNFDLAASCDAEKEVWKAAITEARDQSTMPPFELPASVSPFAARKRRMSAALPPTDASSPEAVSPSQSKRHTIFGTFASMSDFGVVDTTATAPIDDVQPFITPQSSPTRSSFGFTPDQAGRPGQPSTILLKRATAPQRVIVDRGLGDIISESCATARSKAQLHQVLFLPDMPVSEVRDRMSIRDSTLLRRRRSFLDSHAATFDIAFTGEIRGSVIPSRPSHRSSFETERPRHAHTRAHSHGGSHRMTKPSGDTMTDLETLETRQEEMDETTASEMGTLTREVNTAIISRTNSVASFYGAPQISPPNSHHPSLSNLRQAAFDFVESPIKVSPTPWATLNRRQTASSYNLHQKTPVPHRAMSTPVSPVLKAKEKELPPLPGSKELPRVPQGPAGMLPPPFLRRVMKSDSGTTSRSNSSDSAPSSTGSGSQGSNGGGEKKVTQGGDEDDNKPLGTTWQNLRRSMSFRRERPTFSRESSDRDRDRDVMDSPRSMKLSLPLFSRPSISRASSSGVDGGGPASVADSEEGLGGESGMPTFMQVGSGGEKGVGAGAASGEDDDDAGDGGAAGLKRKKSARLFQTLSRFTPM
ncbi:hypothetical protein BD324DRAFT_652858 [Kockovaella imperatae]|uniref:DH domain-containing protein n=1 Tax=Kockovaella imperatae TaxID=4999 RepID=A0A1Y1UDJ5_9TREE|nr:hypothetical protein BD324DRAFT_652858 [Kockovaella imperatae]ORX35145.1 hypothetical protein BD324DRAFT_652858 [Kockovaella imperatae]